MNWTCALIIAVILLVMAAWIKPNKFSHLSPEFINTCRIWLAAFAALFVGISLLIIFLS